MLILMTCNTEPFRVNVKSTVEPLTYPEFTTPVAQTDARTGQFHDAPILSIELVLQYVDFKWNSVVGHKL